MQIKAYLKFNFMEHLVFYQSTKHGFNLQI